jgi:glycosyltransferase 2 family protein
VLRAIFSIAAPRCEEGKKMRERPDFSAFSALVQKFAQKPRQGGGALLGGVISLILFGLAAYTIGGALAQMRFADLGSALAQTRGATICEALLFTSLSYLALTGYDFAALSQIAARAPAGAVALASFTSNAFSFTLGFPLLTGAAVRYWVYGGVALNARQIAAITFIASLTFWLGMGGWLCIGLIAAAAPLAQIDHIPAAANFFVGLLLLAAIAAYGAWVAAARRKLRFWGREIDLPGFRATLVQLALGLADIGCAAATLYALLPQESQGLGFPAFAAIYVFAALLGAISHSPGGVGVFEAAMLSAVPSPSQEALLAALLLFRAIYYLIPFATSLALMASQGGAGLWAEAFGGFFKGVARRGAP